MASRRIRTRLLNAGSADMTVNGSVTPVDFTFTGRRAASRMITKVVLTIHSTGMDLATVAEGRTFGASGLLTNGLRMFVAQAGLPVPELDLMEAPVKQIVEFHRYGTLIGVTDGILAGTDMLIVSFTWPVEEPIRLRMGKDDTLTVKVRDNLTGLALLECEVEGWATS